ncbi:MAG: hypothetical protein LBD69_03505 [Puniceicoccales bacterium]|jgi:hypothetical protein|nr:hypothetical protein [Puniceicoccales bacterium]
MTYNVILKNVFKVDLPPTCPARGFGFPSGHMHFAAIFYLGLILFLQKQNCASGNIHHIVDVMGAVLCAVISVVLFNFIFRKIVKQHFNCLLILGMYLLGVFVLFCQIGFVQRHVWCALCGTCIVCIAWSFEKWLP